MGIRTELEKPPFIAVGKRIGKAAAIASRNTQWLIYISVLVFFDVLMTMCAFWLAYYIRVENPSGIFDEGGVLAFDNYSFFLYTVPFIWVLIFAFNGLYVRHNLLGGTREYSGIFRSASEGFLVIVIAGFLDPRLIIARGWLLLTWAFTIAFVMISRFLWRRLVYALRRHGFFMTPAVIVGANQEGRWWLTI